MRILQIVFLLSVCGYSQALNPTISDILEIPKLLKDVVTDETFKLLDKDVGLSPKVKGQRVLFKKFKYFNNKIEMLKAQMGIGSQILYAIVGYTDIQYQLKVIDVIKNIDFIHLKYKDMGTFLESTAAYEDLTLEEFARSIVSDSNSSLQSLLDRIHAIIDPEEDGAQCVFEILLKIMTEVGSKLFCNMQTSTQQLILYLYNTLALTELKGFLMMEFSYKLLQLHNQGDFTKEIEATQERYKNRSATTLCSTIQFIESADYRLWKCDPDKQVKNETYIEITELLQGYIENKLDLDISRTCSFNCNNYKQIKSEKCDDDKGKNMFCNKNRQCKGNIINCDFIAEATVCHADAGTNRRYDYIKQAGKVFVRKKRCTHNSTIFKGWLSTHRPFRCDYCMCLCDEHGVNSDRYFSLRSSESEIDDNMVVTGLRFVKKNRIIHLQIQEGKLLPRAKIDVTTVRWKPVENYRIDDPRVFEGLDYHMLTWENRSFDLDDLFTGVEEVLTGVRFRMIGSHLNFQIHMTPFNFETGALKLVESSWKALGNEQKDIKKLDLVNKDIPIKSPKRSLPVSKSGMYLEFTHSDLDMDVAQTTVPFIDAQAVASAKPVPLCGAGIGYKAFKNFGGFIYPKIMTYDYSKILRKAYKASSYWTKLHV